MERVLRIVLLTGQRRGEVALAIKAELQLTRGSPSWTIPASRTKNGTAQLVPLSGLTAKLFAEACNDSTSGAVFPAQSAGSDTSIDPHGVTRAMARLGEHLQREDWPTVHDMRRTVGTEMAKLGVPEPVIGGVLNHTKDSITSHVYILHEYADEKRRAPGLWERRLLEIVEDCAPCGDRW